MFSASSLAFTLGLVAGVVLGYLVRDLLHLVGRWVAGLVFRPKLLIVHKPEKKKA